MASELEVWARTERQAIAEDLMWLRGGAKLLSPSGDDITAMKVAQLEARLEHANQVIVDA